MSECKLLAGAITYLLQLTLGGSALGILYFKWKREYPRRELKVFSFDVSKQVIGMCFAHILNMAIAVHISGKEDQCRWYFINYFIDATFGTILNYLFVRLSRYIALRKEWDLLEMGNYQHNSRKINKSYILQLALWLSIILLVKLILYGVILVPGHDNLNSFGKWILQPVSKNSNAELAVVMVVFPILFNLFQIWIQDSFLKGNCHYIEKPYTVTSEYAEL